MHSNKRETLILIFLVAAALTVLLLSPAGKPEAPGSAGFSINTVNGCRIENSSDAFTILRAKDASAAAWILEGFEAFIIPSQWIDDFLHALTRLTQTDPEGLASGEKGESESEVSFSCWFDGGLERRFSLGPRYAYLDQWVLYELPQRDVVLAPAEIGELLKWSRQDFLADSRLMRPAFEFSADQVVSARFSNGGRFDFERGNGGWLVNGKRADDIFVEQLFKNLANIIPVGTARKDVVQPTALPSLTIELELGDLDRRRTWSFYKAPLQTGLSEDVYLASGAAASPTFIIDRRSFRRLIPRLEVLLAAAE